MNRIHRAIRGTALVILLTLLPVQAADETQTSARCEEAMGEGSGKATITLFLKGRMQPVVCDVVGTLRIVEGDIVVGQVGGVADGNPRYFGIGVSPRSRLWDRRVVPYIIAPDLPQPERVKEAIAHWESKTSFRFVEYRDQASWILFAPGDGCSSWVGRRAGGQTITVGSKCSAGNVVHEIGHAVGLWHEQSRGDRDSKVTILRKNIRPGYESNFDQHITDGDDLGDYDYGSVMHYPRNAFSIDPLRLDTVVPIPDGSVAIGQRVGLSEGDVAAVEELYKGIPPAP